MTEHQSLCRHCQKAGATRSRGLCYQCYSDLDIRNSYPKQTQECWLEGVPDRNGDVPVPKQPTDARPGTEKKVEVLCDRAKDGLCLFHPKDAGFPLD